MGTPFLIGLNGSESRESHVAGESRIWPDGFTSVFFFSLRKTITSRKRVEYTKKSYYERILNVIYNLDFFLTLKINIMTLRETIYIFFKYPDGLKYTRTSTYGLI